MYVFSRRLFGGITRISTAPQQVPALDSVFVKLEPPFKEQLRVSS
jgi:hypothetical protein